MAHAVIFGGTKGLGKAVARELSKRGDFVSIFSRDMPHTGEQLEGCTYYSADISNETQVTSALNRSISLSGKLDYLIFCQRYRGTSDGWSGEIEVSLSAPKRIIEEFQSQFSTGNDCGIIFVSSVFAEKIGDGQNLSYHVGKAGIIQMARYFAVNLGRKGIRVNSISPFTYLKEESRNFYLNDRKLMELYEEIIPLGRLGTAEDSASLVVFLCSAAAGFINGQNISVDGGLSLVWQESLARKLKSI